MASRGSAAAEGLLWINFTGPRGAARLGDAKLRWEVTPFDGASGRLPKFSSRQEFFDADKVGVRICLRHWQPGDRFQPIGMKQPVKLQDLFTNLKVPRVARHRRWLAVAESGAIFWMEGLRMGEQFKLDKTTRRRLKWQWWRGVRSEPAGAIARRGTV
ncbi:MAG: tRNA lysidine(34) synthetase TilS [Verrucomicrobia bacterium]|nr:tRNA lysidine(34) synthetase TilS [Verrucomicrobiota bacterium]